MPIDWIIEYPQIEALCARRNLDPFFIAAIRHAEAGAPGREFGVLTVPTPTYTDQLRVCTRTIVGYLLDFSNTLGSPFVLDDVNGLKRLSYGRAFISYTQRKWAPPNVANDPTNLNANWEANVTTFYRNAIQRSSVVGL